MMIGDNEGKEQASFAPDEQSKPLADLAEKEESICCHGHESVDCAPIGTELELKGRSEYEGTMETKLKALGCQIDGMVDKAKQKASEAREKTSEGLEVLKVKRDDAQVKLEQLKESTSEAWGELKTGMDKSFQELEKSWHELCVACGELKDGFDRAATKFNK